MNKKTDKKYPSEYTLTVSFTYRCVIALLLGGPTCLIWFLFDIQKNLMFLLLFSIAVFFCLYMIFSNVEYAIFNHKGLLIVHKSRWREAKEEFYVNWDNVLHIKLSTRISKNASPEIQIEAKGGIRGYHHSTMLPYAKFASLAKYYSGREDIINNKSTVRRKKKPFEKDW